MRLHENDRRRIEAEMLRDWPLWAAATSAMVVVIFFVAVLVLAIHARF